MLISKALLKYGKDKFALLILEFVDIENLFIRESDYIKNLKPYYNILKQAFSSIGYKHTEITKRNLSERAKNRKHSDKTKALISRALLGKNNPFFKKTHSIESKLRMIEYKSSHPVYVYNSFKRLLLIFPSISTLAKLVNYSTILIYINKGTLFRGEWYFSKVLFTLSDMPLISNWNSEESNNIVQEIIKHIHIRKAIFSYDLNKKFIRKYEGIIQVEKDLNINHDTIKKMCSTKYRAQGLFFQLR